MSITVALERITQALESDADWLVLQDTALRIAVALERIAQALEIRA
jgi:hypothetical protein